MSRRLACRLLVLGALAIPAQAGDLQEGLWELTLSMTAAGAPQDVGPFRHTQCLTQADAHNPEKLFAELGGDCRYGDRSYQGNRFSFTLQCGGTLPMRGSGWVEYSDSDFRGELLLTADVAGAGTLETHSRLAGQRRGSCPGR